MSTLSVRRPLVLLAVLGMVATLLFAVAGTASAATTPPDALAKFSACPANADIPDPGFTDTAGFAKDDIDCIAYYGVTTGSTPTTYDPGANVSRHQMALFLARMAGPSGLSLDATPPDAGFTDIGHLPAATQLAINQLVEAGIVKGTTATTYSPAAPVLRQHMALFLSRFADPVNGVTPGPGNGGEPSDTGAPFTDIDGVSVEAHVAINHVYNLGVTTGKTATTYDPMGLVHRDQMAAFMTRLMGQTNARPAGVNIQANPMVIEGAIDSSVVDPDVYSVTARNADFTPAVNVHVDAFSFDADKATDTPFKTDGACDLDDGDLDTLIPGYAALTDLCKVTTNDGVTNTNGNITEGGDAAIPFVGIADPFTTFYAWTGAIGAMFDADTTTYSSVVIVGVPAPPTLEWALLSVDSDPDLDVPFGTEVTWTVQLMGTDDKPFAEAGVDVTFSDEWADDEFVGSDDGLITKVVETDASGKATYSVTEEMIDETHEAWHGVSAVFDDGTTSVDAEDEDGNTEITIWWSAVPSEPDTLVLSTPTEYKVLETDGSTPNSATATVYDQYGDLYTGADVQVRFTVNGGDVDLNLLASGSVTVNYQWTGEDEIETIEAEVVSGGPDDEMPFFWVDEGVAGDMYEGPIFWADVDANELIIGSGFGPFDGSEYGMFLLTWKADDRYLVEDVSSSMAEFESFFDKAVDPWGIVNMYLDPADDGKTSWDVGDLD